MFLNLYLFLLNIISISFCSIYVKNILLTEEELDLSINNLKKYNQEKSIIKTSYDDQLNFLKLKSEVEDIEFEKLLYWKVVFLLVTVLSVVTIVITEPISIFGIRFRYMTLILVIIVSLLFVSLLKKLGVKV